jgi:hypothetical protein
MTPIQCHLRNFCDCRFVLDRAAEAYCRRVESIGSLSTPRVWALVPAIAVVADATYGYSAVDSVVGQMLTEGPSWFVSVPVSLLLSTALVTISWLAEVGRETEESREWRLVLTLAAALPLALLAALFVYYIGAMVANGASWLDADGLLKFSVPAAIAATAHLLLFLKSSECATAFQLIGLKRAESRMVRASFGLHRVAQDLIDFVEAQKQNVDEKNLRLGRIGEPVRYPTYPSIVMRTLESAQGIAQIEPGNQHQILEMLAERRECGNGAGRVAMVKSVGDRNE